MIRRLEYAFPSWASVGDMAADHFTLRCRFTVGGVVHAMRPGSSQALCGRYKTSVAFWKNPQQYRVTCKGCRKLLDHYLTAPEEAP